FTQADPSLTRRHGGTGLGLAITSELIRLMEGRLRLESELGRGSVFAFSIELPIAAGEGGGSESLWAAGPLANRPMPGAGDAPAGARHMAAAPGEIGVQSARPRALRVLLAEDTPANQKVVTSILRKRGHSVDIAENGTEVLKRFQDDI